MINICPESFKKAFRKNFLLCLNGKTQRQLANEIGISEGAISSYACCRTMPNLYIASLIANNLDVSLDDLVPRYEVNAVVEIDPNQMSLI